jgi:hypothetical protein
MTRGNHKLRTNCEDSWDVVEKASSHCPSRNFAMMKNPIIIKPITPIFIPKNTLLSMVLVVLGLALNCVARMETNTSPINNPNAMTAFMAAAILVLIIFDTADHSFTRSTYNTLNPNNAVT